MRLYRESTVEFQRRYSRVDDTREKATPERKVNTREESQHPGEKSTAQAREKSTAECAGGHCGEQRTPPEALATSSAPMAPTPEIAPTSASSEQPASSDSTDAPAL